MMKRVIRKKTAKNMSAMVSTDPNLTKMAKWNFIINFFLQVYVSKSHPAFMFKVVFDSPDYQNINTLKEYCQHDYVEIT